MQQEYQEKEWLDAIDVYSQYFHASYVKKDCIRRAAIVKLTLLKDSEGKLGYEISASFMPFEDEEDFRVPDDIRFSRIVSYGSKRRSKKSEEEYLSCLQQEIEDLLRESKEDVAVYWDKPLREARLG